MSDKDEDDRAQRLACEAFYVRLYQEGKISSGRVGALLGLSRSDFLDFPRPAWPIYFVVL